MMVRMKRGGGMGAMSPWLYEAPPGLVTYTKTPYVSGVDSSGNPFTTGGAVVYSGTPTPGPSSYVAPTLAPAPACTQAAGGAFVSAGCVDQALAVEAQNLQALNDANRRVFVQNCLNAGNSAAVCAARTYGQTPAGGYTSDAFVQGGQFIQDAAGNFVGPTPPVLQTTSIDCQKGWHVNAARNGCDIDVAPVPPKTPATTQTPSTTQNYVNQATAFLGESVSVAGSTFPIWGLAAAGIAALFFLKGGR
jgi:hypothetical protein